MLCNKCGHHKHEHENGPCNRCACRGFVPPGDADAYEKVPEKTVKKRMEDMTEPELSELLTACARAVKWQLAQHCVGIPQFAMVVFNDPALAQYVSTCTRETMIEAMRETADRLEGKEDVERR